MKKIPLLGKRLVLLNAAFALGLSNLMAANWVGISSDRNVIWHTAANWDTGEIPNGAGAVADFRRSDYTDTVGITLRGNNTTVGKLYMGDPTFKQIFALRDQNSTTAASIATLTFDNNGSAALLSVIPKDASNAVIGANPAGGSTPWLRPALDVVLKDSLNIENVGNTGVLIMHVNIYAGDGESHTITISENSTSTGGIRFAAAANATTATNWSTITDGNGTVGVKQASGVTELMLYGENDYSGGTEITNGGTVRVKTDEALGKEVGALRFSGTGGVLVVENKTYSTSREIILEGAGSVGKFNFAEAGASGTGNKMLNGNISGDGALHISDHTPAGDRITFLNGTNTYKGGTIIEKARVDVKTNAGLGDAGGSVTMKGGQLVMGVNNGEGEIVNRALILDSGANTLSVRNKADAATAWEWAGVISGDGVLQKSFDRDLILSGENVYTGGTVVGGGVLRVNNTGGGSGTGSGEVIIKDDARYGIGGSGRIAPDAGKNITFQGAGRMDPNGTLTLALQQGSKLELTDSVTIFLSLGALSDRIAFASAGDWLSGSSTINLDISLEAGFVPNDYVVFEGLTSTGLSLGTVNGLDTDLYSFGLNSVGNNWVLSIAAVPEPGTYAAIMAILALGMVLIRRRRG